MVTVDLYTKPGCHLCEIMKQSLQRLQRHHSFELREIHIREGDRYFEKFKDRIPVLYINNEFSFQYHLPEDQFIARLRILSND